MDNRESKPTARVLEGGVPRQGRGWQGMLGSLGIFEKNNTPDVFPGGEPSFEPTHLRLSNIEEAAGRGEAFGAEVKPSTLNNPMLRRVEGGADSLVAKLRSNYERDKGHLPYEISFEDRDKPVLVVVGKGLNNVHHMEGQDSYVNVSSEKNSTTLSDDEAKYHGLHATKKDPDPVSPMIRTMTHEVNHAWHAGSDDLQKSRNAEQRLLEQKEIGQYAGSFPPERSYVTDYSAEYLQAATAGFNILRDMTGRDLCSPKEMHKALDEIKAKPAILDKVPHEPGRIFRTWLHLEGTNPEMGDKLRNAMARDCQYLGDASPTSESGFDFDRQPSKEMLQSQDAFSSERFANLSSMIKDLRGRGEMGISGEKPTLLKRGELLTAERGLPGRSQGREGAVV